MMAQKVPKRVVQAFAEIRAALTIETPSEGHAMAPPCGLSGSL
jgi:hypothetical protein